MAEPVIVKFEYGPFIFHDPNVPLWEKVKQLEELGKDALKAAATMAEVRGILSVNFKVGNERGYPEILNADDIENGSAIYQLIKVLEYYVTLSQTIKP